MTSTAPCARVRIDELGDRRNIPEDRVDRLRDDNGPAFGSAGEEFSDGVEVVVPGDRHPPARESRQPSIRLAWAWASLTTRCVGVGEGVARAARFCGIPMVRRTSAAGEPRSPASVASRSSWIGRAPVTRWLAPDPPPLTLHGGNGRRDHARVGAQTEVVVAREVEQVARFRRVQATREGRARHGGRRHRPASRGNPVTPRS